MKKIIGSLILILFLPFRLIKKIKLNGFIAGTIFGAIFSLLVNVITIQLQEIIQKQRVLEAIENEVLNNLLQANNVIEFNNQYVQDENQMSYIDTPRKYSRDLWEQSSEPLQYIAQLDQQTQVALYGFYTISIPEANNMLDKANEIIKTYLDGCYPKFDLIGEKDNNILLNNIDLI